MGVLLGKQQERNFRGSRFFGGSSPSGTVWKLILVSSRAKLIARFLHGICNREQYFV